MKIEYYAIIYMATACMFPVTFLLTTFVFADPNPPKAIWFSIMVSWIIQVILLWVMIYLKIERR